jgi:hypothetical protein
MPAHALPIPSDPPPEDGILRHLGIEGCVRLAMRVDAAALAAELARLPAATWTGASRDPVVQASVQSFFVIGYPRGPKPLPYDDRPPLAELPALRRLLRETFAATPTRAIVARTAAHGFIPIHTDTPRFFRGTVRLSIQVVAGCAQRLYCGGRWYHMKVGEVWAVDNLQPHAVHDAGPSPRINVLVDYKPSDDLIRAVAEGERGLGVADEAADREIEAMTRERYRKNRWRSARYELFKFLWRRRV